jgi:tetratricopeptide (TPR) repeat protein
MEIDASVMIGNASNNSQGYALRAIARREKAIEQTEKKHLEEAVRDHNKAIKLSPEDPDLYNQRRQTQMQMGNYAKVLSDARECVRLRADESIYHFHVFYALVALGHYDEAKNEYEAIIESGQEWMLHQSAAKYVSDTLAAGLSWHPPERRPEGTAFLAMHESADVYHQLAKKARRVVGEGFHATWSPDGTELAYSRGILGFSGIEAVNLENGKSRLLTVPGLDPAWSPDGNYIAFTQPRQTILVTEITIKRTPRDPSLGEREVWIIKADGTEKPRLLAKGYWPCWSRDSKRVLYHTQPDMMLYSISIEEGAKPRPIVRCPGNFPLVSPDEKYITYSMGGEYRIMDLSTKSVVTRWPAHPGSLSAFLSWSPNGQELCVGDYGNSGLWIYELDNEKHIRKASKVLSGSFSWSSWSRPEINRMVIQRVFGGLHRELWVADLEPDVSTTEALGPGRTLQQHCQELISLYNRRIKTDPEDAGNYYWRAKCYVYLQDGEKAFADLYKYTDIVKNPSQTAQVYASMALDLVVTPGQMVDLEIAAELFRKAHEIERDNWFYLTGLSATHYRAGQWEEAIMVLSKSTELPAGENSLNFLLLSMTHWQSGNKDAAANWYKKAIEWMQKSDIDITYTQRRTFQSLYLEASELMGIKVEEFDRNDYQ